MVQVKRVAGYQQEQETPLGVSEHNLGKQVFTEEVIGKAAKADPRSLTSYNNDYFNSGSLIIK